MKEMTKVERIRAAINKQPTDKLPYSFWTHMPGDDLDPQIIAQKTYDFYKEYDLDFIKMMNNGMYSTEDFGCVADYSEIKKGGAAKLVSTPVNCAEDWAKLTVPDIHKGAYGRELEHLRLLLEKVNGEAPILFTIFTPISTANKISVNKIFEHIAEGKGDYVKKGLEVITETTCQLAKEVIRMGADGIFFASQIATYEKTDETTYAEYGVPYDMRVLEAAKDGWFNTIHAHGEDIMFNLLKDYPVNAFNWHAFETYPSLTQARDITGKCLVGGLKRYSITDRKRNEIQNQIYTCLSELKGVGHILTPGCVVRYPLDKETLSFVRQAKEDIESRMKKLL